MKRLIMLILTVFILGACSEETSEGDSYQEFMRTYPNHVGEIPEPFMSTFKNTIIKQRKEALTGNVIAPSTFGYDMTLWPIMFEPGDTFLPDSLPNSLPEGYTLDVTLDYVDRHGNFEETISTETFTAVEEVHAVFPEVEEELIRVTVDIYNDQQELRDTSIYGVFTRYAGVNTTANLYKYFYSVGEIVQGTLRNHGPNYLYMNENFTLFQANGDEWEEFELEPFSLAETLEGPPQWQVDMAQYQFTRSSDPIFQGNSEPIYLPNVTTKPGEYMLRFEVGTANESEHVYVRYEVK